MTRRPVLFALIAALLLLPLAMAESPTRLLRFPDISDSHVVFSYGGDLWIAGRDGGDARRLTSFPGVETAPKFSPDGQWVAFQASYDGNADVYVVPTAGGEPERLTWHPLPDTPRGWTPDGQRVVFASAREGAPVPYPKFWTVSLDGGLPSSMALPRAWRGKIAPDGGSIAYEMVQSWESEWRNYRGGQNKPIQWIDLETLAVTKLPWDGSNDMEPVFLDGKIYFLSDRDYAVNVWAYDTASRALTQVTKFREFDVKNLEEGGGRLVFENGGTLFVMDPATVEPQPLAIHVRGDFPWARPHWEDLSRRVRGGMLSPTGKRAILEARGEVFTVPAEKGNARNLTRSPGSAERAPSWAPDGQSVAWFSDASGEYQLVIADQHGEVKKTLALENPTFFYDPEWSPDSKHIAFTDADRVLWLATVESGAVRRIDDEGFAIPGRVIAPAWSPDSRFIAYTGRLPNQYAAVFVYSLESEKVEQITDGLSDCRAPAWDKSGKYLYFLGSTDYGPNVGWLDMSSYDHPVNRAVYLAVLSKDTPSPLLPESDDEEVKADKGDDGKDDAEEKKGKKSKKGDKGKKDDKGEKDEKKDEKKVVIDFAGLEQRTLSLGVPSAPYIGLLSAGDGTLFLAKAGQNGQRGLALERYTLEKRKAEAFLTGVSWASVSADGKKLLYGTPSGSWAIVGTKGKPKPGDGKIKTAELKAKIDPAAEWKQIFREAWRYQRDYFYVDNVHGLDLDAVLEKYMPLVDEVRHRSDLTHLLDVLGGETAVGHSFARGGDEPDIDRVPIGLLGVDFELSEGRYRFARIYDGESWNPELRAPLRGPGLDVATGDYLIAVDGVDLKAPRNPYSLFDRAAGRQVRLTLSAKADGSDARTVTVVPVANEIMLRGRAWVEDNRRKVDELSGGKLAYVWLPNTGGGGYTAFNRYYYAQQDRKGIVVDERWNGGGSIADYMIDVMARTPMGFFNNPLGDRQPFTAPNGAIFGPKVMIINDAAGSGGDMLPYMFRLKKLGPLVGTRTWGGLVGIWDVPALIDGGFITAPRGGFFDNEGRWAVENEGVPPDVEVEMTPALVNQGKDPQLEKAVAVALELLEKQGEFVVPKQPADPVRVRWPE